ncbi:MAG: hypothetical protein ABEJ73_00265 [Haloplanus sp.]
MSRLTHRGVAAGAALAAVGFAAWYGYAPTLVPAAIRTPVEALNDAVDPRLALVVVGGVAGVLGLLYVWLTEPDATASPMAGRTYEEPGRNAAVAGRDLSERHERAIAADGPDDDDPLRRRLRAVVVAVHRDDRDDPEAYVDRGAWTDDRYAAAFLSTTADVDYPWYHRLYAWLYPGRAYERRVERALHAVERACTTRLAGYEAPDEDERGRLRALLARLEASA